MAEQLRDRNEQGAEYGEALKDTGEQERLAHERERKAENAKEKDVAEAEHEVDRALKETDTSEQDRLGETPPPAQAAPLTRQASFKRIMGEARTQMSAPSRAFSKVIHAPIVEKTSEAAANTVARPNAMLAGSLSAFVLVAVLYFWASHVGYPLSGFETIAAFIIGWLLGIIIDFGRIMLTGKSS